MGVHGKSFDVIRRIFGAKMIKEQKRIDIVQCARRYAALEFNSRTFKYRLGLDDFLNFTFPGVHIFSSDVIALFVVWGPLSAPVT